MHAFLKRLSAEVETESFSLAPRGGSYSGILRCVDPASAATVVVIRTAGGSPRIIATGSYLIDKDKDDTAEVALAVEDPLHGQGLGSLLLERLAVLAVRHGIRQFWAVTHVDNRPMLEVFHRSGFQLQRDHGYVRPALAGLEASVARSELLDRLF
jgi:GNAT superfamily N-acetyltransferase